MKITGVLKIGSITDPFKGLSSTLPKYEVIKSIRSFSFRQRNLILEEFNYLSTAGPSHPTSMLGIWKDIKCWSESPLWPTLKRFISLLDNHKWFLEVIETEMEYLKNLKFEGPLYLGRLSLKEEAAGKIRVFAISDSLTQTVMNPLSQSLFKILKSIPMDGTFDQDQPIRRLRNLWELGKLNNQPFYSYDLSSATDRLPLALQEQVLSVLYGEEFSSCWATLLKDRDWYLKGKPIRYTVGQPMGVLSSWSMLALTHHCIVRIASTRVGLPLFDHYALLGDDIVIANREVALSYHNLITEVLGVDINLSKTLISADSFEFAKRLITFKGEVSPVGAKNLLLGLKSARGLSSIILDLVNKGLELSELKINQMYDKVPMIRKSQVLSLKWLVLGPFGFIPTADGLTASLRLTNSLSAVRMDILLSSIDRAKYQLNYQTFEKNIRKTVNIIVMLKCLDRPIGVEAIDYNFNDSPVIRMILRDYKLYLDQLIQRKPVYRLIFDGPLVFTNFYRESWMKEMLEYITSKIKDSSSETVSPNDPFADDKVLLPFQTSMKGEDFFALVQSIDLERRTLLNQSRMNQ